MLCIRDHGTDPFFNLAAEEYALKNFTEDCFMLWSAEPSVIVGKHQNTLAEIDPVFIRKKHIKVARRISGGGAVFHDHGNLNFTFIANGKEGHLINFRKFTAPILEVLKEMDIEAKFEGRNDLTINGKKFSGNAEHIWKQRTLHHGTLLFSAQIEDLSAALKSDPAKFTDKAVKSIRSHVTNISDHLKVKMKVPEFRDRIMDYIKRTSDDAEFYEFTPEDIREITRLRDEKFSTWEWNFGYSPKYSFHNEIEFRGGYLGINMEVEKGLISEIVIQTDLMDFKRIRFLENSLTGARHDYDFLLNIVQNTDNQYIMMAMF